MDRIGLSLHSIKITFRVAGGTGLGIEVYSGIVEAIIEQDASSSNFDIVVFFHNVRLLISVVGSGECEVLHSVGDV